MTQRYLRDGSALESLILTLDTLTHEELARIGGKAAQLWKLQAAGFPVPPSFCLTTTAFQSGPPPLGSRRSRRRRCGTPTAAGSHLAETTHSLPVVLIDIPPVCGPVTAARRHHLIVGQRIRGRRPQPGIHHQCLIQQPHFQDKIDGQVQGSDGGEQCSLP